jgi:hypothetical protein
MAEEMKAI